MPCYHPVPVWKTQAGTIVFNHQKPEATATTIRLPCQKCLGCEQETAKEWALRCSLEAHDHLTTAWATLTYDDHHKPITLEKKHVQQFMKNIRKRLAEKKRTMRFFASGEYGEQTQRPHYHAILYGVHHDEDKLIQQNWTQGHAKVEPISPARIAYTAGYTAKKLGWRQFRHEERIDYETGEIYNWQPPFIQMSRRPGIGGTARKYTASWKDFAVLNGTIQRVPRYLHEAWKAKATPEQITELQKEKREKALTRNATYDQLEAMERDARAKQEIHAQRRPL